jgi:holo-[acyl-carrier protein] synthase
MAISIGNDIISNERVRKALEAHGERFLNRIFTEEEQIYCLAKKDPVPHLAARFACKEAFIKAVGLEPNQTLDMKEIELLGREFGKKRLCIYGKSKEMFTSKGFLDAQASISHCEEFSTAVVLLS